MYACVSKLIIFRVSIDIFFISIDMLFLFNQDCSSSLHFFEEYQHLPTKGAMAVEQFSIDGTLFLAFANLKGDILGYKTDSYIYKLNDSTAKFSLYQTIDSTGGLDMKYFTIANENYLAVANRRSGTSFQLNSTIYRWNTHKFVIVQNIPTLGATSFHFFKILPELFLSVTNSNNGTTKSLNSVIYKWKDDQFEKFQETRTEYAMASTTFAINNSTFIVFANRFSSSQGYSVQSSVYKWSVNKFVKLQSLQTYRGWDVKSFNIKGDTFLTFANSYNGNTFNIDSVLYKWNGSRFIDFQSIPTHGAVAMNPFVMCGQTFLGVANDKGASVVYRFTGSQFIKYQENLIHGARDVTSFKYKGHTYLAIAQHKKDGKFNVNSTLYKWI